MIYLKCTLAGLAALFVIFVILPLSAIFVIFFMSHVRQSEAMIYIDRSMWSFASPVFWTAALIVFGVGFFWKLHKLTK